MSNRFGSVAYDDHAKKYHAEIQAYFESLETAIFNAVVPGRETAIAMTKLEEAFMWVGKALKAATLARREEAAK